MATEQELRQKVIGVGQSWIGCKEADGSHKKVIDAYNSQSPVPNGYRVKYTDSWCATYVTACFFKAGLVSLIPPECSCPRMIAGAQKMGIWVENDAYVPSAGDIIMYDWDDNGVGDNVGVADHVGLVEKIVGNTITVLEGNMSDAVGRRNIQVNGKYIRGYITPNFASKASGKSTSTTSTSVTNTVSNSTSSTNYSTNNSSPSSEELIWKLLYNEIKNAYGVAGLMGNLYAESGLHSNNLQDYYNTKFGLTDAQYTQKVDNGTYSNFVKDSAGYGLAQWTYWSRKQGLLNYIKSKKVSIDDTQAQVEYLIKELNSGYKAVMNSLKTAKTVKEASDIVLTKFECPAIQTDAVKNARAKYGQNYYNRYKNGVSNTAIQKGDKVKVVNAITYTGSKFAVYSNSYDVVEVKGDRAVIASNGTIVAAINVVNLQKI